MSSSSGVAPRDSSLRSRMTAWGDVVKDLGRIGFVGRSKPLPYRLMKNCLSSADRLGSGGDYFLREDHILPYDREIRSVWFRYAIFQKIETRRWRSSRPTGFYLRKKRIKFCERKGEPPKRNHSQCFLLVLFFRERKEHASSSASLLATLASSSRPILGVFYMRRG